MKRYYIRYRFRNSEWSGVIYRKNREWAHSNGQRAMPVAMTEQQALNGLRSTVVKGLRFLARNEDDDLTIELIEHNVGPIRTKSYYAGPLAAIAGACK